MIDIMPIKKEVDDDVDPLAEWSDHDGRHYRVVTHQMSIAGTARLALERKNSKNNWGRVGWVPEPLIEELQFRGQLLSDYREEIESGFETIREVVREEACAKAAISLGYYSGLVPSQSVARPFPGSVSFRHEPAETIVTEDPRKAANTFEEVTKELTPEQEVKSKRAKDAWATRRIRYGTSGMKRKDRKKRG